MIFFENIPPTPTRLVRSLIVQSEEDFLEFCRLTYELKERIVRNSLKLGKEGFIWAVREEFGLSREEAIALYEEETASN